MQFFRLCLHAAVLSATIFVAGCGGGTVTPDTAVSALRARMSAAQAATPQDAAQQVMDFGEVQFPQYFPTRQANNSTGPFLYRYYAQTGVYLGVVVAEGAGFQYLGVYVMGGAFGNSPQYVGPLGTYLPQPVTAGLALSGTVSRNAALSGATVNATCQTGSASALTQADGTYSLTVPEGVQPCILSATSATTGLSTYSASVSGNHANITTLTDLMVAGAIGKDPGTADALSQSATFAALTAGNLSAALQRTVSALQSLGISVPAGVDPITTPLVAGTPLGGPGDAVDQAGVQLAVSLGAANLDLGAFANLLGTATSAPQAAANVATLAANAGIPTSRLAGCPFAVTGKYWLANSSNGPAAGNGNNLSELQADFGAMTAVWKSNVTATTRTYSMTAETDSAGVVPCGVVLASGATQLTFRMSAGGVAGVGAVMGTASAPVSGTDFSLAVFAQPLALSDLAGSWYLTNYDLGEDNTASPTWGKVWTTGFSRMDVAASGAVVQTDCSGATAAGVTTSAFSCSGAQSGTGTLAATASPGLFRYTASSGAAINVAAFRATNGDMAFITQLAAPATWALRSFGAASKRVSNYTIRPVNDSWQSGTWTLSNINSTATNPGAQQAARSQVFTVTAVDGSRLTRQDNSQPPRIDTLVYDAPYSHMIWRPAAASVAEWVAVSGWDWTLFSTTNQAASGFFGLSILRY